MNWLLIVVSIFLAVCAFNGYRLGFVKKLFTMVSFIITIIVASVVTPYISDFLINSTPVYTTIKESTAQILQSEAAGNKEEELDTMNLPVIVKNMITKDNGVGSITAEIHDYIGTKIADTIINGLSFALAFIVITLLLRTIIFTLDIIANLPIIKGVNQYAGLVLGGVEGIIIVWLFFVVVTVVSNTPVGTTLINYIYDSKFLSFIYNNNYFFKLF